MDSRRRSIIKALSWRVLAVLITMSVTYFFTRRIDLAAEIGILDSLIKIFIYYMHERTWTKLPH
jgi:adenylylsulfate kinase